MVESRFHLVSSSRLDAAAARPEIAAGLRPRHFLFELADRLGAVIHEPDARKRAPNLFEAQLLGLSPALCAALDRALDAARAGDVIYCNGDGAGIALAARIKRRKADIRLVVFAHNMMRPRLRAAALATDAFAAISRLHAITPALIDALRAAWPARAERFRLVDEQADDAFFRPGPAAPKRRPLIVGVGLEQRDYRTLAEAAAPLDADVRISAFSKDARRPSKALPETNPANMQTAFYPWPELAQLYRDADIVVAPLFENRYAAGITTILEAAATGRPIIASRTQGIAGVFSDPDAIVWTPPGDAAALRAAIEGLLADPARREALAGRARAAFLKRHRKDDRVAATADELRALAGEPV